jgi:hypothetical protein
MNMWNDDEWPMNIQNKDEEQKLFHKAVSSAFLLMLDSNNTTLPLKTLLDLCHPTEAPSAQFCEDPTFALPDALDEKYGQLLDIMEGLKMSFVPVTRSEDEMSDNVERFFSEFLESSPPSDDDVDIALLHSTDGRGGKTS